VIGSTVKSLRKFSAVNTPLTKHAILFLAANPLGTDRLALDEEARAIQAEFERSGHRDKFELVTRWAARPLDLLRELRKLKPTVVHFSGHGGPGKPAEPRSRDGPHRDVDDEAGSIDGERHGLFFEGPDGRPQLVSTAALEETFSAVGSSVKLVVLNACYSEVQAEALLAQVGCVVGMGGSIRDDAARNFAIGFYGGIGECESVAAAYKQGRAAISLEGIPNSEMPQLKVRDSIDADQFVVAEAHPENTTPDIVSASIHKSDEPQVPRHQPGVDPDPIRLLDAVQPTPPVVRPWYSSVPRIVGASVVVGASVALVVMLRTKQPQTPTTPEPPVTTAGKIMGPTTPEPPATAVATKTIAPATPEPSATVVPAKTNLRTTQTQTVRPGCRSRDSQFRDETVRGPTTVVSSMTYGAFLYAKCIEGPCMVKIVNHGTSIRAFPMSKDQEWTGYQKLLGDELRVVRGLLQLTYCTLDIVLPK